MSETDLGKALLGVDAMSLAGVPDVKQQTWAILERDRRSVRRLTRGTVAVWLLAFGLLVFVHVTFGLVFPLQAKLLQEADEQNFDQAKRERIHARFQQSVAMLSVGIAWAVVLLALAALLTVRLLFVSRRATLRQVNASLLEISQQVKDLRQMLARPSAAQ